MDDSRLAASPPPRLIAALSAIVVYFLLQLATGLLVGAIFAITHAASEGLAQMQAQLRDPQMRIALTVIILPVSCVLSIGVFRLWFKGPWKTRGRQGIGLSRLPWPQALLHLLLGMLAMVAGGMLTLLISRGHVPVQDISQIMEHASLPLKIGLALTAVTLVPLAEEILFRGILLPSLVRHLPVAVAVAIDAGLFALVHLPDFGWRPEGMVALALLGVVCCWRRIRTGSIFGSVAVHAGNNLLAMVLLISAYH